MKSVMDGLIHHPLWDVLLYHGAKYWQEARGSTILQWNASVETRQRKQVGIS